MRQISSLLAPDWGAVNGVKTYLPKPATRTAPMLIDADGLYWLKNSDHQPATRSLFITPHAGEAATLLSTSAGLIEADRMKAAKSLVTTYKCHALLKGPGSVVIAGTNVHICAHGGPAMATAGMGDVLSGICAGLLAPLFVRVASNKYRLCVRSGGGVAQCQCRLWRLKKVRHAA